MVPTEVSSLCLQFSAIKGANLWSVKPEAQLTKAVAIEVWLPKHLSVMVPSPVVGRTRACEGFLWRKPHIRAGKSYIMLSRLFPLSNLGKPAVLGIGRQKLLLHTLLGLQMGSFFPAVGIWLKALPERPLSVF